MTEAKTGTVWRTSLGPNLLTEVADSREKCTYEGMANSLKDRYGEKFSKATIRRALDAAAVGLEPEAQNMRDSLKDADHMGYDKTSYPIMGKSGWAQVAASHDMACYHLAASSPGATFEEHVMVPGWQGHREGHIRPSVRVHGSTHRPKDVLRLLMQRGASEPLPDCKAAGRFLARLYAHQDAHGGPRIRFGPDAVLAGFRSEMQNAQKWYCTVQMVRYLVNFYDQLPLVIKRSTQSHTVS